MSKRGGDVAFYGLLLCVSTLAISLSLIPLHHRRPTAGGATASTEPKPARGPGDRAFGSEKAGEHATKHRQSARAPVVTVAAVRGPSWIVIRARYTGRVLYRGMLEQGHVIRIRDRAAWAQIGAVGNVEVRFRHRLVQLGSAALTGVILTEQGALATQPGGAGVVGS